MSRENQEKQPKTEPKVKRNPRKKKSNVSVLLSNKVKNQNHNFSTVLLITIFSIKNVEWIALNLMSINSSVRWSLS